ncbi:MAG: hypothetical protein K6F53_00605, partial [Lachnospiraceae bacterium]|nr:hypothetical protein [Lachnospiraceae bacterium]
MMKFKKEKMKRMTAVLTALILTVSGSGMAYLPAYAEQPEEVLSGEDTDHTGNEGEFFVEDTDLTGTGEAGGEPGSQDAGELSVQEESGIFKDEISVDDAPAAEEELREEEMIPADGEIPEEEKIPAEEETAAQAEYSEEYEGIPAEGDAGFAKNKETTLYGTSGMSNPRVPTSTEDRWQGSYVYYGKAPSRNGYGYATAFLGKPIKYRVLDRYTTLFHPSLNSVLLDSDVIITTARYYNGPNGGWSKSYARELLNGERFLENDEVFTDIEKSSIINSYKNAPDADDGDPDKYAKYPNNYEFAKLTGEKVFFLDIREAFRPSYGYSEEHDFLYGIKYVGSRIKADPKAPAYNTWYT